LFLFITCNNLLKIFLKKKANCYFIIHNFFFFF